MRIVAGLHRGRTLVAPGGENTRPTLDRTREAVFSSLGVKVIDAVVLDAFAGSGAMGLEALSRGAQEATFLDIDTAAVNAVTQNVNAMHLEDVAKIFRMDACAYLQSLAQGSKAYTLVFLDPPYHHHLIEPVLTLLTERQLLAESAVLVAETAPDEELLVPKGLCVYKEKWYGKNHIRYVRSEDV